MEKPWTSYNCFSFEATCFDVINRGWQNALYGFAYEADPSQVYVSLYAPGPKIGDFGRLRNINGNWTFEKEIEE